ncbi:hypothetical protein MBLNU230_g0864t1 [Neophaeotheca triangularis]
MHSNSASVSAASTGSGGPPPLNKQQSHASRPSSMSSASVVTIRRTASLSSSSTGPQNSPGPLRSQSPSDTSLRPLRPVREQHGMEYERRNVAGEPQDTVNVEGLGNLNRWSQSTDSSMASGHGRKMSSPSGGHALSSITTQQLSPPPRIRTGSARSPGSSPQMGPASARYNPQRRPSSPTSSPQKENKYQRGNWQQAPPTALPPLHTSRAQGDPFETASPSTVQTNTPSTTGLGTPSTISSYANDYFGAESVSPRTTVNSKRPMTTRNNTAPLHTLNHSRTQGSDASHISYRSSTHLDETSRFGTKVEDKSEGKSEGKSGHGRSRTREKGERDKKSMLSKALQKANTAVLLDKAQNFDGALEAYGDACALLQQVMDRSSGADDKRKLEAIRITYTNRIDELKQLAGSRPTTSDDKDLPARPMSDDSATFSPSSANFSPVDEGFSRESAAVIETARATKILDIPQPEHLREKKSGSNLSSGTIDTVEGPGQYGKGTGTVRDEAAPPPNSANGGEVKTESADLGYQRKSETDSLRPRELKLPPAASRFTPAPLSPRRPLSPYLQPEAEKAWQEGPEKPAPGPAPGNTTRSRGNSNASVSWLDTIDESASSCSSSVHSRASGSGMRRKHIRNTSQGTNPEFDAAFDAAVEAAYDDGYEPDYDGRRKCENVQATEGSGDIPQSNGDRPNDYFPDQDDGDELDDEEEERLLDEITSDYVGGFSFDLGSKSALPRQSDSSAYSRSTWQSSHTSDRDRSTAGTSLSTVAEHALSGRLSQVPEASPGSVDSSRTPQPPPLAPPPMTALPRPPSGSHSAKASLDSQRMSVRSRRLSGRDAMQLRIETSASPERKRKGNSLLGSTKGAFPAGLEEKTPGEEKDAELGADLKKTQTEVRHQQMLQSPPTKDLRSAVSQGSLPNTASTSATTHQRTSLDDEVLGEMHSAKPRMFRKNKSSLSLRDTLAHEDGTPASHTPMSSHFMSFARKASNDPGIAQRSNFHFHSSNADGQPSGGAYLFDTSLSSAAEPMSPRSPTSISRPVALEPCPESFLLRPFWLMRAMGNTLTHQKGGFLTNRLFVPHEVWKTKGVKLKSIEEKIANCDLLTAALGRLAGVDTFDADAVMEELQNFEEVMERVQAALVKKLGSEVGVQGINGLFRDAPANAASATANTSEATAGGVDGGKASKSKEGKSYLASWRKLRSKSSGTPLASGSVGMSAKNAAAVGGSAVGEKELSNMPSVPMTSFVPVQRRGQSKPAKSLAFDGPNREYMSSLARLFEAAQVLDQIARQVEDPGLKHSSPTHVGLELSMRHAAEFFGFYICRFAFADLGTLTDKFVKRGSEWALL